MENDTPKPMKLDIAAEFPPQSWEEWMKAVEATLKGVPYEKVMITKTYEGIDLKPIYRKEDIKDLPHLDALPGFSPYVRGNKAEGYLTEGWKIAQEQNECDPAKANKILMKELNRGLNSLNIKLDSTTLAGKIPAVDSLDADGVSLSTLVDFKSLLNGVNLTAVPITLKSGSMALTILALLNAYIKDNDIPLPDITGCIGFDPLGELAKNGKIPMSIETAWQQMYQMTYWADMKAKNIRTILIDSTVYGNSGCNAIQELAYALSTANEYINAMLEKGLSIEQIAPHCQLNLSLGSNFFMEIAKVRAARLLWAELMKAYGASDENQKIWIHGVTSNFNKTVYDPFVNILRTATEGFSGVIGGIDSMELTPFDALIRPDEEFSRRIARNQQIILGEEAHFEKVIDPAGGCYYIETVTAQLAEKAWSLMQDIDAKGGMLKALKEGLIQSDVKKTADERISNVDKRKDVFIGVNMFANNIEQPLEYPENECICWKKDRLQQINDLIKSERNGIQASLNYIKEHPDNEFMVDFVTDAWLHNSTIEEISKVLFTDSHDVQIAPLPSLRVTQHIEDLRTKVIDYQQQNETVLSVFLANMGPIIQHKARADFAMGFLQVGGFYVANNEGFDTVDKAVEAALFSKSQAVCICSTDDTYPELVPALVQRIKLQKPDMIFILAGYPQDMVETYKSQGIDIFIHLRANALETLTELVEMMGVK